MLLYIRKSTRLKHGITSWIIQISVKLLDSPKSHHKSPAEYHPRTPEQSSQTCVSTFFIAERMPGENDWVVGGGADRRLYRPAKGDTTTRGKITLATAESLPNIVNTLQKAMPSATWKLGCTLPPLLAQPSARRSSHKIIERGRS